MVGSMVVAAHASFFDDIELLVELRLRQAQRRRHPDLMPVVQRRPHHDWQQCTSPRTASEPAAMAGQLGGEGGRRTTF